MQTTVLITTAIRPPAGVPYLEMSDASTRTIATRTGIFFWASQKVKNIVVADATGSTVLDPEEVALLGKMGLKLEQIHYKQNDDKIRTHGKGYGEGLLIDYAIKNSAILSRSDRFFKCTGKLFCRNFHGISNMVDKYKVPAMFWPGNDSGLDLRFVDLRFYLTTKDFFTKFLLSGYLRGNDGASAPVEATCTDVLNRHFQRGSSLRPKLSGFSGGYDVQIDETSLGDLDYNFPCWAQNAAGSTPSARK